MALGGGILGPLIWRLTPVRRFAIKSDLPITWTRPEKIPCIHPAKSGDLSPLSQVDLKVPSAELKESEELKTADPNVKKLFSLEFSPYKKTVGHLRQEYISRVQRHKYDLDSPEVRVARMTCDIRDMQRHMEAHPHDKRTKVRLKETIDKRHRLLKKLREWDYKLFEWVLEKLELTFKLPPPIDVYMRVERKRSLRMLTDKYCENIVSSRLREYREKLEDEQEKFLEDKLAAQEWIMKEEKECRAEPTVTGDDLSETRKKLQAVKERNQNKSEPLDSSSGNQELVFN